MLNKISHFICHMHTVNNDILKSHVAVKRLKLCKESNKNV